MRLGYLVPELPSQTHAFFWREVQCLRARGVEVVLYSTRRPPDDACKHAFAAEARRTTTYVFPPRWGVVLAHLAAHPLRAARAVGYVLRLAETPLAARAKLLGLVPVAAGLARAARAAGVEHLHVHSCANAAHLAALAELLGGPGYSLTLHGDLPVYGTDHRAKMRGARFVSTVTRALQRSVVQEIGLPAERVPVIWMGVDTRRLVPPDPAARPAPLARALRIATVARLNATKGHVHVLAAQRRLLDRGISVRYTIAGDGPHRAAIEAEIARLGLAEHVRLAGSVGEDDVARLLAESDAFVLASFGLGEAAPVSVMEAMSAGLPVVCSIIGGTPDMLTDGVDGLLVPQQDEAALEKALERLATDPDLRARLARAARARACAEFDQARLAERLEERIRTALAATRDR
jgi:glycosyltransferase involved in cell wall biosynthesis